MSRPRLIALLLALLTLVVYLPVTCHDFLIYDDGDYVTGNQIVQQGLTVDGLRWAFTTFYSCNWHPLTWLSHMADCEFFRLDAGAHHFVNALFHAANTALLFVLLWRSTAKIWPATLVAAIFAWHPLHVESVAWVAERKDVLSNFFALLALLSYVKFVQANCRRSFWLALMFFAFGLLAKPMLVTLPFVLLLLDFWPLQRFSLDAFCWPLVREKALFFLLAAASCVVTVFAQSAGQAIVSLAVLPMNYRLENATIAAGKYLLKILWPADLAVIYPPAQISSMTFVLAGAVLVLLSAVAWRTRNRNRCWLFGWVWFLGTLVPVIGLVQVGSTTMADRYTYIPSIGIFIAVVFGLNELPWSKKYFWFGGALLSIACVGLTERQLRYWHDSETLFRHTLAITHNNEFAHLNLGHALALQDRNAEALAEFREGMRLNTAHYSTHFIIGNLLAKMGRTKEALAEYRECLRIDPEASVLHNAAGIALAADGNLAGAFQEFTKAEQFAPQSAEPHIGLAKIYFTLGRDTQAVGELKAAVRANPDDFQTLTTAAHFLAANSNAVARDGKSALILALKANDLSHNRQPDVFDVLGMAFAATGDFTNAVTCAQNALEFVPVTGHKNIRLMRQRLALYQNHQLWLESFRNTNAPPGN